MEKLKTRPFEPIYQRLFNEYKKDIQTHCIVPGSRIDSISKIQKKHKVARETAKLVLKKLADEGYVFSKPGKGSYVADIGPKKKIWAVVLPSYHTQYKDLLEYLFIEAKKAGREIHHFVDYNNWEEEIRLTGMAIAYGYEAAIVVPTVDEPKTYKFYSQLSSKETIITLLDHTIAGSYFSYVIQSYDLGITRGMQYLLEKGNGGVVFVKNLLWEKRNLVQQLMAETYINILKTERPDFKPEFVSNINQLNTELFKDKNIDGILCCDDSDAIQIIGTLKEKGINIPESINLVSYGNTALAKYFTPAITSINPHNKEMAKKIAEILAMRIKGKSAEMCQYVIQPEIVIRDT